MTEIAKLFYQFWNQLGIPAYVEGNVPTHDIDGNEITPPYITYSLGQTPIFTDGLYQVRVWTYSTSFAPLMGYCDQISELIPTSGVVLELGDGSGSVWIKRGTPWQQLQPMGQYADAGYAPEDTNYKVMYISLEITSYIL